jgi:hypothetical protein
MISYSTLRVQWEGKEKSNTIGQKKRTNGQSAVSLLELLITAKINKSFYLSMKYLLKTGAFLFLNKIITNYLVKL